MLKNNCDTHASKSDMYLIQTTIIRAILDFCEIKSEPLTRPTFI